MSYLSHFCIWSFVTYDIVQLKWRILNLSSYDRFSHICHNSNWCLQHMTFSVISVIKVTCDIACNNTYLWQIQSHLSIQIVLCYTIMTKYLSLDVIFWQINDRYLSQKVSYDITALSVKALLFEKSESSENFSDMLSCPLFHKSFFKEYIVKDLFFLLRRLFTKIKT